MLKSVDGWLYLQVMKFVFFLDICALRYRLRGICKAIGIKPYRWQKDFALGRTDSIRDQCGRATGKTTAVMIRLLLDAQRNGVGKMIRLTDDFSLDPDWDETDHNRRRWYYGEYLRLYRLCREARIPGF